MDNGYIAIIVLGIALLLCMLAAFAFFCRASTEKKKATIQQEQQQAVDLEAPIPCAIQSDVAVSSVDTEAFYKTVCTSAHEKRSTAEASNGDSAASTPSMSSSVRKKKKKSAVTLPEIRLSQSFSRSNSRRISPDEFTASPIPMENLAS